MPNAADKQIATTSKIGTDASELLLPGPFGLQPDPLLPPPPPRNVAPAPSATPAEPVVASNVEPFVTRKVAAKAVTAPSEPKALQDVPKPPPEPKAQQEQLSDIAKTLTLPGLETKKFEENGCLVQMDVEFWDQKQGRTIHCRAVSELFWDLPVLACCFCLCSQGAIKTLRPLSRVRRRLARWHQ